MIRGRDHGYRFIVDSHRHLCPADGVTNRVPFFVKLQERYCGFGAVVERNVLRLAQVQVNGTHQGPDGRRDKGGGRQEAGQQEDCDSMIPVHVCEPFSIRVPMGRPAVNRTLSRSRAYHNRRNRRIQERLARESSQRSTAVTSARSSDLVISVPSAKMKKPLPLWYLSPVRSHRIVRVRP